MMAQDPSCDETEWAPLAPESQAFTELIDRVAPTPLPVLLIGETGSGKEVAAERLHKHSRQAPDRFLKVNCASFADSIVESELFGHERGAFTNAHAPRAGLFECADGGTLFLDEIAELAPRTQAKLLRVLESGEIVRLGSSQPRLVRVRVIAATHRDLERMVAEGTFREDLYFRLNAITVRIPPLRARVSEIVPLAERFAHRLAHRLDRPPPQLSEAAVQALLAHRWPGNIRELRHVIERALVMSRGGVIEPADLKLPPAQPGPDGAAPAAGREGAPAAGARPEGIKGELRSYEKQRILVALELADQNQTRAAELLGLSRRTLTNKLNAHGIQRPRKKPGTHKASG